MNNYIEFNGISKNYGSLQIINDLSFSISKGEFVSLLGPSGSGKTTLLMLLAGFEQVTGGEILIDGERVDNLPPHKRNMGVVFQNYALFPHMTIAENIAFPLKCRKMAKLDIKEEVHRVLEMVKLSHLADRLPSQLSGGQQQRIALARALVFKPEIVLMDEPLGALDKQLREHMQMELRELHKQLGLTVVFVTHDQNEAITMSDRVAIFNAGKIEQAASPKEIYFKPNTKFVADFIGQTNLIPATEIESREKQQLITLPCQQRLSLESSSDKKGASYFVSIRPESINIGIPDSLSKSTIGVNAVVQDFLFQGDHVKLLMDYEGYELYVRLNSDINLDSIQVGKKIDVFFSADDCVLVS